MPVRRFFAAWTALAILIAGLLLGPVAALDDHYRVDDLRSQETRLGESYRTASGERP